MFFKGKRNTQIKRALIVANDHPTAHLAGPPNDAIDMASFLVGDGYMKASEIRVITGSRCTADAVRSRLDWLTKGLQPDDLWLFYYSGHGTQLPARNNEGELDGLIEGTVPYDFDGTRQKMITDTEYNQRFSATPKNSGTAIFDSCFSGGIIMPEDTKEFAMKFLTLHDKEDKFLPMHPDHAWRMRGLLEKQAHKVLFYKNLAPTCLVVSACREDQTAADAVFNRRPNGALTYYLLRSLKAGQNTPMSEILETTKGQLVANGYDQVPSLEGNLVKQESAFLAY